MELVANTELPYCCVALQAQSLDLHYLGGGRDPRHLARQASSHPARPAQAQGTFNIPPASINMALANGSVDVVFSAALHPHSN